MHHSLISSHGSIIVSMQHIAPHDQYDRFAKLLVASNYLLPSAHVMQNDVLAYCLLMHPISAVRNFFSIDDEGK